jgi:hypothetical protein
MKERPILFSGPMVRAILEGRKTQTRRIVKPPFAGCLDSGLGANDKLCPYGAPGDSLWVRENIRQSIQDPDLMAYEVDDVLVLDGERNWPSAGERKSIPSIHMPRWASRIILEMESVRVERLQSITETGALAEGSMHWWNELSHAERASVYRGGFGPVAAFECLWDSVYARKASWASNPWVWVVEFKPI